MKHDPRYGALSTYCCWYIPATLSTRSCKALLHIAVKRYKLHMQVCSDIEWTSLFVSCLMVHLYSCCNQSLWANVEVHHESTVREKSWTFILLTGNVISPHVHLSTLAGRFLPQLWNLFTSTIKHSCHVAIGPYHDCYYQWVYAQTPASIIILQ